MLQKISAILLASLILASCGTMNRERKTYVSFASYQAYPDMWISPNTCPMQHTVLGQLAIDIIPAVTKPEKTKDGVYLQNHNPMNVETIAYDELLEIAVAEARSRGANGISNLEIKHDAVYRVTGLLIKIE